MKPPEQPWLHWVWQQSTTCCTDSSVRRSQPVALARKQLLSMALTALMAQQLPQCPGPKKKRRTKISEKR